MQGQVNRVIFVQGKHFHWTVHDHNFERDPPYVTSWNSLGTVVQDDDNDTDKGETAMGDDTEPNERELILGVLSSDNLANEMSGVGVSSEVGVEIYLGTAIGVEMVVGVEGARYNISV